MAPSPLSLATLTLCLVLSAPAVARADDVPPTGHLTSHFLLYGHRYSSGSPTDVSGGSGGLEIYLDWLSGSEARRPGTFRLGLVSEAGVGFGSYSKYSEESRLGFDLTADILGAKLRYQVLSEVEVGLMWEPVEVVVYSLGGFLGSKIELSAAIGPAQVRAFRGANGYLTGFATGTDKTMGVEAVWRLDNGLTFGGRYFTIPLDGGQSARALGLVFGFSFF